VTLLSPVPLSLGGESVKFLVYLLYTKETIGQVLGRRPFLH